MVRPTIWPIDPHTQAKHIILRRYLDAWLPIMATWNNRIVVIDGFAGPGRYTGGEEGSPLIALRALLDHPHLQPLRPGLEVRFYFVEERGDRSQVLDQEIARFRQQYPIPDGVHIEVANREFAPYLNEVLVRLEQAGKKMAPTFGFIDPFGFSGIPMDLIARLSRHPSSEVLVSFMLESINRWAWHGDPKIEEHLDELFGTREWRALAREADGDRRRQGLVELYRRRLIEKAGFEFVINFEMIDQGNRTEYFLYFATKSLKGLSVMKQAMWRADPVGGQLFSDRLASDQQLVLVSVAAPVPLRDLLQRQFRSEGWVPVDRLEQFVLTETIYSEKMHLRRQTLGPMEKGGLIEVKRPKGKRKAIGQYPKGTLIRFL